MPGLRRFRGAGEAVAAALVILTGAACEPAATSSNGGSSSSTPAPPGSRSPGDVTTSSSAVQSPPSDPIAAERGRRGTSSWRLTRPARNGQIEGYLDAISALPGTSVTLRVSTAAPSYRVQAYRFGAYRGGLARQVWASKVLGGHRQPAAHLVRSTRTVVARWRPSLTVATRSWAPGAYLFKLTASSGYQAYVPFVVRSPTTTGRVALVAPVATWQAYNNWGGYSLYVAPPGSTRSWAVSYNRPFPAPGAGAFLYGVLPVVVQAERTGVPLAYLTNVDIDAHAHVLDGAAAYVSMGHDEYWTDRMRTAVLAARNSGTNLMFLGADTEYWRIRMDDVGGPSRLEVGYKTDAASDPIRARSPAAVTGAFRDPPDPHPENGLTGMQYECFPVDTAYRVVSPNWWGFRGTAVRAGDAFPHLVGIEADRVYPVRSTPRPLQVLSYSPYNCRGVPTSAQSVYYTARSGAGVFTAGTLRWTCALKPTCGDTDSSAATRLFVRRVTDNLLQAMSRGPVGRRWPARDNVPRFSLPKSNQVPAS
jgi:N,N-dimethylformamidase beta subunit-like, C-terminal